MVVKRPAKQKNEQLKEERKGREDGRMDGRKAGRNNQTNERTKETHVRLLEYPVAFVVTGMFSLMLIYKEKKADFGFLVGKVSQIFASLARYGTKNTPTLCRERHI